MKVRLPTPPKKFKEEEELLEYLTELVRALERAIEKLPETPFTRDRIKVTGLTKQYTLDSAAGTLADTRSVLGTLLVDLQQAGKLS